MIYASENVINLDETNYLMLAFENEKDFLVGNKNNLLIRQIFPNTPNI